MNSHQRRQENRKFKYIITFNAIPSNVSNFWNAVEWCEKTFSKKTWIMRQCPNWMTDRKFKFTNEKDAIIFALNWL